MPFKYAVLKEASKPVRGPRVTCVGTYDTEAEAIAAAANEGLEESTDAFYVAEVIARSSKTVEMLRAPRDAEPVEDMVERTRVWVGKRELDDETRVAWSETHCRYCNTPTWACQGTCI